MQTHDKEYAVSVHKSVSSCRHCLL